MEEAGTAQRESQLLLAEYPDERQRTHATRWLGWVAYRMDDGRDLAWWQIPAGIPARRLRLARRVVVGATLCLTVALAATFLPSAAEALGAVIVGAALLRTSDKRRVPRLPRPGPPVTLAPRWPQRGRELGLLALWLLPVVTFLPFLLGRWTVRATGDPQATYRADRRTSAAFGLAWALGTIALGVIVGARQERWLGVLVSLAVGAGLLAALMKSTFPLVKLTELVLLAQWRERVCFDRLLADAAERGVLRRHDAVYRFIDPAAQAALVASHEAVLIEQVAARTVRAARVGARSALLAFLTKGRRLRISVDFAAGAVTFVGVVAVQNNGLRGGGWGAALGRPLLGAVLFLIGLGLASGFLRGLGAAARWSLANVPDASRKARYTALAIAAVIAGLLVAEAGAIGLTVTLAIGPAAFVAACGLWAGLLTNRRVRTIASRRTDTSRRTGHWLRFAPDVIAAATTAATLLVLAERDLLTTAPAAGLLFPPAIWGSIGIWRSMNKSERLAVKAGADIALSLLLGTELVLFLIWLVNLLSMPRHEVAALRAVLERTGAFADPPWWLWTGLYVLLAGASVAFMGWPARLGKSIRWFDRLRVVSVANVTRRVLSGVHIGLLVIVLIGLAAPAALRPTLKRELKDTYTLALQRELEGHGEAIAYTEISRQFNSATQTPAPIPTLLAIVTKIHETAGPPPGRHDATDAETDLARRLGELQALALALRPPPALPAAEQSAAAAAGFDGPVRDSGDLRDRLTAVEEKDTDDDASAKRAEQAGDLAAAVVASTISIPSISDNEVFQIVREYLGGLIEDSPLKDVFAAWAERLSGRKAPADADALVVPDPARLEQAAAAELSREYTSLGTGDPVTDPLVTDPSYASALKESPIDASVDLANQVRYAQENDGSPCPGCARPENPFDHQDRPIEEHPFEP
jgi:hypothetical protein